MKELESVLGTDNKYPTPTDLNEMKYLEMAIKETMRYYTVAPFLSRMIDEDISFGEMSEKSAVTKRNSFYFYVGDIFIPKGLSIIVFLYGLHMNPEYFPNPEKFDPTRFEKEVIPYTFMPFGGGPRNCIGKILF